MIRDTDLGADLIDAEHRNISEVLIGALIQDANIFQIVDGIIKPEDFESERFQYMYAAVKALVDKESVVNPATVLGQLEELNVQHWTSLQELNRLAVVDVDVDTTIELAKQLASDAKVRRAADKIEELQVTLHKPGLTSQARIALMSSMFDEITRQTQQEDTLMFIDDVMDEVERQFRNPYTGTYIKTGIRNFDTLTGGLRKRWVYVVAARAGNFKSTFVHNVNLNTNKEGIASLVYPLEMEPGDYILREAATDNQYFGIREMFRPDLLTADQREEILRSVFPKFRQFKTAFHKTTLQNMEVRPKTILRDALLFEQRMKTKDYYIVVDYIGLMSGNRNYADQRANLEDISRNLKNLARVLDVPIIAVAQMNRNVEGRKGGEPELGDMAGSDGIVRDADFVMFLRVDEDEPDLIRGYVKKHRNGPLGQLVWKVQADHGRFNPIQF